MTIRITLAALLLAGCTTQPDGTTTLTPQAAQQLAALCKQDAAIQPLANAAINGAAVLAPVAGPTGVTAGAVLATSAALDQSVFHPGVVELCKQVPVATK